MHQIITSESPRYQRVQDTRTKPSYPQERIQIVFKECGHTTRRFENNDPHNPNPLFVNPEVDGLCAGCKNRAKCPPHRLWSFDISREGVTAINKCIDNSNAETKRWAEEAGETEKVKVVSRIMPPGAESITSPTLSGGVYKGDFVGGRGWLMETNSSDEEQ